MTTLTSNAPILVVGGGIGGLAAALALAREGCHVKVLEQARAIGEIGAGIQLGPNAFAALDTLGVGESARGYALYAERLVMIDAVDGEQVVDLPVGEAFRNRFGNPYAVIHRTDVQSTLLQGVQATDRIEFLTSARIVNIAETTSGVTATDADGKTYGGSALIGCDGVKSVVRQQLIGDSPRLSGDVVYRALLAADDFPGELRWNAPVLWVGPDCHIVHYPVHHGEHYNLVVTFQSSKPEIWDTAEGSQNEVLLYFDHIDGWPRRLLHLPKSWTRWVTADREPLESWGTGRVTLLGDAAHPMLQYLAQGACLAIEDAVTLGAAVRACRDDLSTAFALYERSRIARTARAVLSAREFRRLCHARGIERLVRNELWKNRTPERFYDALEWLYGWLPETCLAR